MTAGGPIVSPASRAVAGRVVLTAGAIAAAMSGHLVCGVPGAAIDGFSIDSRTLRPGDLFIAIGGDRFDGHRFVGAALAGGACGAVVSDVSSIPAGLGPLIAAIRVTDTISALQGLARHVRRQSGATVVAITGSAGKTTTKEIAADLLASRFRVFRTQGNLNNHIGLPLSLLELRHGPEVAVLELGMNHAGEIRVLVGLAEPDVRVWTNVAEVHAAFFASTDAIADAKAEILEGAGPDTVVVANAGDARVMARARVCPARVVTFGVDEPADVSARDVVDSGVAGTRARVVTPVGEIDITVPLVGRGHLANVLAATAVALQFDVPLDAIAARVKHARPASRRGEVWRLRDGIVLVDDSYNSNPRALQRMLEAVAGDRACTRRLAVLGEMLELGDHATQLHEACGRSAARAGLAHLVTVGGAAALAMADGAVAAGLDRATVTHVAASGEAADLVTGLLRAGDLVLVKGSRAVRTDIVADRVKAEAAVTAASTEPA